MQLIKRNLIALTVFVLLASIVLAAESSNSGSTSTSGGSSSSSGSSSVSSSSAASGARQSGALIGGSLLSKLGAHLSTLILPAVGMLPLLLLGLGVFAVPAFGLGMLLREGRRSDSYNIQPNLAFASQALRNNNPMVNGNLNAAQVNSNAQPAQAESQNYHYYRSFPSFNLDSAMVLDVLEKVMKALDNADKKFN